MSGANLIEQLVESLRCLPGVGPKSARRMAYHLLERNREAGRHLSQVMAEAMQRIGRCARCRTLTEDDVCEICRSSSRDDAQLCIVESPVDLDAIEAGTGYRGRYFVLMGLLSPLDGVGPKELGLDRLDAVLAAGVVKELIIATGTTVEGQATAHYISEHVGAVAPVVQLSRIAHGVPIGGELEFVDGNTLVHAFKGRRRMSGGE